MPYFCEGWVNSLIKRFRILFFLASIAIGSVVVNPLVGADFNLSPDIPPRVGSPTVSAGNSSFLVVWNDYRAGETLPQLYASIVSASGLASTSFPISSSVGLPVDFRLQRIETAFDGASWLVVWSDDRPTGPGIRGSIVSSVGDVLGGNDFLIASTPGTVTEDPLVVFNGIDFVVAWHSTPPSTPGGSQIFYTRVSSGGTVAASQVVPANITPISQALLFLAPQKTSGDTLFVYRENTENPAQTRSVRVVFDGSIRDPGGTSLFKTDQASGGFGKPIAACFVDTEWHILSTFDQSEDSSIFLHKINPAGTVTPPQGIFAELGLGPTGSSLDQFAPAFAGTNEWLFVRNERITSTVYHLLGKRVSFTGEDKDPIPFQIDNSTQGILRNAVAAQSGKVFLVAWLDGRTGASQPADATNIAATLVDAAMTGTTGTALVSSISASPLSGEAPLAVEFDSATSTGSFDTLTWDFGDGTSSTQAKVSHTYKANGTYFAQLKLSKGSYLVFDTVVITVGSGSGSGDSTQVGIPVENSVGMETGVFLSSAVVRLDFVNANNDVMRITGILDAGQLPESLTGVLASVAIGSKSTAFNLDAKGEYKSDPAVNPFIRFSVNAATGEFAFDLVREDLSTTLDALGASNETVKPAKIVNLPVTITLDALSGTATVGAAYKSTQGVSGAANYEFLGAGNEVSGSFLIFLFKAQEDVQAKTGLKVHSFAIKGQVVKPAGGIYKPAATGEFNFTIGNYTIGIPVGELAIEGGHLKVVARRGISGLKKFSLDLNSGKFNLQLLKVPAEVSGGSGLPVAKSGTNIVNADLNLSFQFELAENEKFSAGRYILIARKNAAAKNWKPR